MPEIAAPIMPTDEDINRLADRETLGDIVWVLNDWNELATWLHQQGAPQETEDGLLPTSLERVKWVIRYVEKATLIGD